MKYVQRGNRVEHHPENEADRRYLIDRLGAPEGFDFFVTESLPRYVPLTVQGWRDLIRADRRDLELQKLRTKAE